MPSLKTVGQRAAASASQLHSNYAAVWSVVDSTLVDHNGRGYYMCTGGGENIGNIRTIRPLDPQHKTGMSTFEMTIVNSGKTDLYFIVTHNHVQSVHA